MVFEIIKCSKLKRALDYSGECDFKGTDAYNLLRYKALSKQLFRNLTENPGYKTGGELMKRCGLHHSGRGMESHYEGVIIDGRAYIKAPAFRGSASKSEILEDGTIRSSGGYDFEDKDIFDKFQSDHPIVYGFIEMEGWEPIAVFLSERSKHITIGGEHYFPPICYPYFEEECDNGLVQLGNR